MSQATATREKAEKEREAKRDALKRAATASASSRATAGGAAGGAGKEEVESGDEASSALRSPGTAKRHGATLSRRGVRSRLQMPGCFHVQCPCAPRRR